MTKISALVITKNEEEHLSECLESLKWVDEIIVIDSGSIDKTVEIAKKYTPKVYFHKWPGYSEQKNWGATKCKNEWIISVDADEQVSKELKEEIVKAAETEPHDGYWIPTKDFMFGRWILHGGWYPQEHIRLYKKAKSSWGKNVHETITVDGSVGHLTNPLLHFGHTDILEFVGKLNIYTQKEADDLFQAGERGSISKGIFLGFKTFMSRYFKYQGYKDGEHGLLLAILMSFYIFNTQAKLWEKWYKKEHEKI